MAPQPAPTPPPVSMLRQGTLGNGMEFLTWGRGPRTLLFIPGGPGSDLPRGLLLRLYRRMFVPYVEAGFAVWIVTRRRGMPPGHTVAEMAADHADAIVEGLGGQADLVVGESYGGMIAQYLAALHPERFRHLAVVVAGCEVSAWGKAVDGRLADAIARDDLAATGAAFLEYLLPSDRARWLRRLLGPLAGRLVFGHPGYPRQDVITEIEAELAFDSREVLPRIESPVLMICGDRDRFFPRTVVETTAALIPDCTLLWYAGKGHVATASSKRVAHDVLDHVDRHGVAADASRRDY